MNQLDFTEYYMDFIGLYLDIGYIGLYGYYMDFFIRIRHI